MNELCGRIVDAPLLPAPETLWWTFMPQYRCSYAIWGAVMNDGRKETYIQLSPWRVNCQGSAK